MSSRSTPRGLWAAVFALVIAVAVSARGIALAGTENDARWSIDLGAISISEALDRLTQITGIRIFTGNPLVQKISPKRYTNQSIEQILKDMLRNVSHAAVWHYSERGIESIEILAFDRERAESQSAVSSMKRVGTIRRPISRGPGPGRLHLSGQVGGSERDEGVKQPPAEPEETEGSEADERDEESVKSSTEADDTSNLVSSEPQVEPATDSSNREESPSRDQQNESEESGALRSGEEEDGRSE